MVRRSRYSVGCRTFFDLGPEPEPFQTEQQNQSAGQAFGQSRCGHGAGRDGREQASITWPHPRPSAGWVALSCLISWLLSCSSALAQEVDRTCAKDIGLPLVADWAVPFHFAPDKTFGRRCRHIAGSLLSGPLKKLAEIQHASKSLRVLCR